MPGPPGANHLVSTPSSSQAGLYMACEKYGASTILFEIKVCQACLILDVTTREIGVTFKDIEPSEAGNNIDQGQPCLFAAIQSSILLAGAPTSTPCASNFSFPGNSLALNLYELPVLPEFFRKQPPSCPFACF